jgi:hypothetical protein
MVRRGPQGEMVQRTISSAERPERKRRAAASLAALILTAAPAMAADLCQAVTAGNSQHFLRDGKSGGIVQIVKPASFPDDARAFVVKSDPTFEGQKFEIFPLGADGAGLAVHYEGSEAEQYAAMFDRVKGRLRAVEIPNLNPEAESYLNMTAATVGGVPVLFLNQEKSGETITRIAPWQNHAWGAVCQIVTPGK